MSSSDDYFSADEDAWDEGSFLDMRSVDLDVLVDFGFFVWSSQDGTKWYLPFNWQPDLECKNQLFDT